MSDRYHIPVLLHQTIELLVTNVTGIYVDGTLGGGGHTAAILEKIRNKGTVLAFDADPGALRNAEERFAKDIGESLVVRQAYFRQACEMLEKEGVALDGVLLDLGVSSRQLDSDQIGLSYRQDMPLDMRFDPESDKESARDIINRYSAGDIATLLRKYGEEPAAWKIAQAITKTRDARRIETTTELREVIEEVIPERFLIKTLSRVFQALRIAVNDELGELEEALDRYTGLLKPGGRFAILTYHSLEDRIVKQKFREEAQVPNAPPGVPGRGKEARLKLVTRKPILPSPEEVEANPRSRSAKLRVAEKL